MTETAFRVGQRFIRPRWFKTANGGHGRWPLRGKIADAAEAVGSGTENSEDSLQRSLAAMRFEAVF